MVGSDVEAVGSTVGLTAGSDVGASVAASGGDVGAAVGSSVGFTVVDIEAAVRLGEVGLVEACDVGLKVRIVLMVLERNIYEDCGLLH